MSQQWIESIAWPEPWMRDVALSALPYGQHVQWYVWVVRNNSIRWNGLKFVGYDNAGKQSEWVKDNVLRRFWNFISPNMSKIRASAQAA